MSDRNSNPQKLPFSLKPKTIVIIVVVIALIILLTSSFFVVDQQEQAVVLRFGRYNRTVEPGLNFKLPFGIEKNYNVPITEIQRESFGFRTLRSGVTSTFSERDYPEESIMLTGDLNIIDVEWIIQYRIVNPQDWLFKVQDKQKTIRDVSQSIINQLVGDRAILDVIGNERANIELIGQDLMNETFDDFEIGINVTSVRLQNIVPPVGRVQDAFEDVNRAIQDMNRLINEGKEAFNREVPKARGQASQLIEQALGYAARRTNEARGDSDRFLSILEEYRKAPDTTRTRLYYETIEQIFGEAEGTDLIDKNLENFIPLKSLQNRTPEGGTQ
ncbi:MAG: FtsH protease activity modulator HflK [Spirochaetia bacterium]